MIKYALLGGILMATSACTITQHVEPDDMKCPGSPKCVSSEEQGI
jgi:hypothetical protein